MPPEYGRFLSNSTAAILGSVSNPTTACTDADVYISYRRRTYAVQKKGLASCGWKFGTATNPLTLGNIDQTLADEEKNFAENRNCVCSVAAGGLADDYDRKHDYNRTIDEYSRAIQFDPKNANAFKGRCYDKAIIGQLDAALADCNRSLALRPDDANALDSRGFVNLKSNEFNNAIVDYNAALEIDPEMASSLYGRGLAKLKFGDTAGGKADIAAAKAVQADIADVYAAYGVK